MDVHHQVSSSRVLHDKAHVFRGLETRQEIHQEGMTGLRHHLEDPLLAHQTDEGKQNGVRTNRGLTEDVGMMDEVAVPLNLVPGDDVSLFQGFDGVQIL